MRCGVAISNTFVVGIQGIPRDMIGTPLDLQGSLSRFPNVPRGPPRSLRSPRFSRVTQDYLAPLGSQGPLGFPRVPLVPWVLRGLTLGPLASMG